MLQSLHKNTKGQGLGDFERVNTRRLGEGKVPREGMEAPLPFPHTLPQVAVPKILKKCVSFYNKLVI